jgi:acyl-CoA dehydrogenase
LAYKAPLDDFLVIIDAVRQSAEPHQGAEDTSLIEAILQEAGKFASEELAPLNWTGDRQGARRNEDGSVTMPSGFAKVYHKWCDAGWNSLTANEAYGGQGLSHLLASCVNEIWSSANMSFHLCPLLTTGAVEALQAHASDHLKETYLPSLVSGQWTGTMNLTEPQAGSDLSTIKTKAVRGEDETYHLYGQKIYITYGEHDMSENIIHLVLARIEGAPEGTKGISLFLVPKILPDGSQNDVMCSGAEQKIGIHASPTCTMIFGDQEGATGWLVGEENRGLNCMFTMMNNARLNVGLQGVGIAERATQAALGFAHERKQGTPLEAAQKQDCAILAHSDVRRMVMEMKTQTAMGRAICLFCAHMMDLSDQDDLSNEERLYYKDLSALLTPIAKAFGADIGVDIASMGIQVHGGMGYVEETGVAQYWRDARIAPIYEGTNGIQAMDLVMRKVSLQDGAVVKKAIAELKASLQELANKTQKADLIAFVQDVTKALQELLLSSETLVQWRLSQHYDHLGAVAVPYLKQWGLTLGSAVLVKAALLTDQHDQKNRSDYYQALAAFAVQTYVPQCQALHEIIVKGSDGLAAVDHPVFAL